MAHHNTVFRQLLDLLPRHEFDAEARQHQKGQRLRVMSRWAQFVALGLGQLAGLQSLRDIVGNLCAQPHKLYHLGVRALVSRSSLARGERRAAVHPLRSALRTPAGSLSAAGPAAPLPVQEQVVRGGCVDHRPVPGRLPVGRRSGARRGPSSCMSAWTRRGICRASSASTDGKAGDVTVARTWTFPAGSVVVADRTYLSRLQVAPSLAGAGRDLRDPTEAGREIPGAARP